MSLNIKKQRVHDLAREVARRTGRSQTSAIEVALERYLAELDAPPPKRSESARAILDEIHARMTDADRAAVRAAMEEMYDDESGLPV